MKDTLSFMKKDDKDREKVCPLKFKAGGYDVREVSLVNVNVRNFMEQSIYIFLPLLWMSAVFVENKD
jgi:hypothetical protein